MNLFQKVMQKGLHLLSVVIDILRNLPVIQTNLVLVPVPIKRTRFNQ
jgi:hypothetical protein